MADNREPRPFVAEATRILVLDQSSYSRMVMMEVLRGVGLSNDNVTFDTAQSILQIGAGHYSPDVVLYVQNQNGKDDYENVTALRRMDHRNLPEAPFIYLSPTATKTLIEKARDVGFDEFIATPVSPAQLAMKLRKVIEDPRPFVTSATYTGPCRRRKASTNYTGLRRRLDDFNADQLRDIPDVKDGDALTTAVTELRAACGELSDERLGLVARVREIANRTATLAQETGDIPLERTANAVKHYLDGVGSSNLIEPHVLETGINALTQLSVLPNSYDGARQSVASLMKVAVRKKLAHYHNRRFGMDSETEALMSRINGDGSEDSTFDLDDVTEEKTG